MTAANIVLAKAGGYLHVESEPSYATLNNTFTLPASIIPFEVEAK